MERRSARVNSERAGAESPSHSMVPGRIRCRLPAARRHLNTERLRGLLHPFRFQLISTWRRQTYFTSCSELPHVCFISLLQGSAWALHFIALWKHAAASFHFRRGTMCPSACARTGSTAQRSTTSFTREATTSATRRSCRPSPNSSTRASRPRRHPKRRHPLGPRASRPGHNLLSVSVHTPHQAPKQGGKRLPCCGFGWARQGSVV